MNKPARGHRRGPNYRTGPVVPMAWKIAALAVLGIAASISAILALKM